MLRLNYAFPEHDMYTLFVDGRAVADVTGNAEADDPLVAGVGALKPFSGANEPVLDSDSARAAVSAVARYADYGSERGDPCVLCCGDGDGLTPA